MRSRMLALVVAGALVLASSALASPVEQGYGGRAAVQGEVAQVGAGGALPFTGLDLALLAIGSVLLLAVGVALRRAARAG